MSIDTDDTSDSPIQFGLEDKSLKVLQEHSRRLEAMVTAVKGTLSPGAGGQFSGKFLQVAQQQLIIQKDIANGMRQLNLQLSKGTQLQRQYGQMAKIEAAKYWKSLEKYTDVLGGKAGGGTQSRMTQIWNFIKGLPGQIMNGIRKGMSAVSKIWEKTGGKLFKKTGGMGINKLLGLGGATIIGALVGKMISSSPLLQAMFKIMNTSLTLIMRPIGDFFGAFIRPMSIYFLKEVAIPFFQAGRGWMKIGEKWGKIAVGFFVNPGMAMKTAMLQAAREIPLLNAGISANAMSEADFFQEDPAAWARVKAGIDPTPSFMLAGAEAEVAKKAAELIPIEKKLADETEKLKVLVEEQVAATGYLASTILTGEPDYTRAYMAGEIDMNELSKLASMDLYNWSQMQFDSETGNLTSGGPMQYTTPEIEAQKKIVEEQNILKARNIEQQKVLSRLDNSIFKGMWELFTQGPGGGGFLGESDVWDTVLFNSRSKYMRDFGQALKDWFEDTSHLENASYASFAVEENFEDILRSTQVMAELTNIAKAATETNTRSIADLAYNTGLKNHQIMAQYGLTTSDIGETSSEIKERLFVISSIYKAVETDVKEHREEILKVQDEAIEMNKKYNLGLNEHFLLSANINSAYARDATRAFDTALSHIVKWEHMNELQTAQLTLSLARQTDMITSLMTDEPGSAVDDAVKLLTNSMMGVSSQTHPWISGGADDPYMPSQLSNTKLKELMDFMGPEGFEHMISQGQYFTETGKMQQAFQYQGPGGQIVKSGMDIPKTWDVSTQGFINEPGWQKIPDQQTALINATIAVQRSVDNIQNQLKQDITAGLATFSSSAESQAYVTHGGGLYGLQKAAEAKAAMEAAAAEVKKAETSAALASQGLQVLTIGGISYTVPANTSSVGSFTNQGAIPINLSGVGLGGLVSGGVWAGNSAWISGGGSGGGGSSAASSTYSAGAAQAAGYSTGSATNAQFGGIIDEPIIGIGMHSGREWSLGESGPELVTPVSQLQGGGGLGNIIINIGNITKEADYLKLKPLIQRWILEASSRRGMV